MNNRAPISPDLLERRGHADSGTGEPTDATSPNGRRSHGRVGQIVHGSVTSMGEALDSSQPRDHRVGQLAEQHREGSDASEQGNGRGLAGMAPQWSAQRRADPLHEGGGRRRVDRSGRLSRWHRR